MKSNVRNDAGSPMTVLQLQSTITCPHCGQQEEMIMPVNACLFFHECAGCHETLRPRSGDCCVFCSYGSVPCPQMQGGRAEYRSEPMRPRQ